MPQVRRRAADTGLAPLTEALHAAALDGGLSAWAGALERVADALGAGATYLLQDGGEPWGSGGPISVRVDPSWARSYVEHYAPLDPLLPVVVPRLAPGDAVAANQITERAAMLRTEFAQDWCRPQGMDDSAVGLVSRDASGAAAGWGALVVTRLPGAERFGRSDLRRLETLLPHVRRAVAVGLRLGAARAERDALAAALERVGPRGAMLVDARGRVVFANSAAEALLAARDSPLERAADGTLRASARVPARVDAELRRLLAAAAGARGGQRTAGSLRLPSTPAAAAWKAGAPAPAAAAVLEIVPLGGEAVSAGSGAAALVLVEVPRPPRLPSAEACRDLFGFTPAEARVALVLAERGCGLKALARELGVSPTTARTHLQRLFGKTGTHRQAELAVLLRGLAAPP